MRLTPVAVVLAAGLAAGAVSLPAEAREVPQGSYLQSCRNIQADPPWARNPVLRADCADRRGRWRATSLAYGQCPGDIANENGRLVCAAGHHDDDWQGPYGGGPWQDDFDDGGPHGGGPYGPGPYGQDPYGQGPYGHDPYGHDPYGQGPYGPGPYGEGPSGRAAITLFDFAGGRGQSVTLSRTVSNLKNLFNDRAESVRVTGGVWQLCIDKDFRKGCLTVDRSQTLPPAYRNRVSSVRRLR